MKQLVKHLLEQHTNQIVKQSLKNCHVRGLDSIMFLDTPEQRIRLFVARPEHELWKNTARTLGSLAAHSHHCDITLHCVKGAMVNLEYELTPTKASKYRAYRYQSCILTGQGKFTREVCAADVAFSDARMLEAGTSIALPAELIHSVQLNRDRPAAWFVYEGKENRDYGSLSYSDQNLEQADFTGLYQPMTEDEVVDALRLAELL